MKLGGVSQPRIRKDLKRNFAITDIFENPAISFVAKKLEYKPKVSAAPAYLQVCQNLDCDMRIVQYDRISREGVLLYLVNYGLEGVSAVILVHEEFSVNKMLGSFAELYRRGGRKFLLHGAEQANCMVEAVNASGYTDVIIGVTDFSDKSANSQERYIYAQEAYKDIWDGIFILNGDAVEGVFQAAEAVGLPSLVYVGKRAQRPILVSLAKSGTHLVSKILKELGYDVIGPGGRPARQGEISLIVNYAAYLGDNVPRWAGYEKMHEFFVKKALANIFRQCYRIVNNWFAKKDNDLSSLEKALPDNICISIHSMPLNKIDGPFFVRWSIEDDPKIIFNYRDPRAVISSYVRYLTKNDKTVAKVPDQYIHSAILRSMNNIDDQINHAIRDTTFPYSNAFRESSWLLLHPQILSLRYEDVVGDAGGGSEYDQIIAVARLMLHLNISGDPREVAAKGYSTKTATFGKGKIGTWKEEFSQENIDAFNRRFGDLLSLYGYE